MDTVDPKIVDGIKREIEKPDEQPVQGLDISYLEEAVREEFLKHFPLGYNKKRTALMQGIMRAFAEYIVADKKRLLHGMKRALEEKQRREGES